MMPSRGCSAFAATLMLTDMIDVCVLDTLVVLMVPARCSARRLLALCHGLSMMLLVVSSISFVFAEQELS